MLHATCCLPSDAPCCLSPVHFLSHTPALNRLGRPLCHPMLIVLELAYLPLQGFPYVSPTSALSLSFSGMSSLTFFFVFVIIDIDVHAKLLMVNQRSQFPDTLVFSILRNQKKGSKQSTFVFIGIDIHAELLDKVNAHGHHKKHVHC